MRQEFADVHAALAGLRELADRAEQLGVALDERESLALGERLGHRLAGEFVELRLRLEEFKLRRRAGHEQIDDRLGLGGEVRLPRRERIAAILRLRVAGEERSQRHRANPHAAIVEEVPARPGECERVVNFERSHVVPSLARDELIEVHQHASDCSPGESRDRSCVHLEVGQQTGGFGGRWFAREAEPEGEGDPAGVVGRAFLLDALTQGIGRARRTPGRWPGAVPEAACCCDCGGCRRSVRRPRRRWSGAGAGSAAR